MTNSLSSSSSCSSSATATNAPNLSNLSNLSNLFRDGLNLIFALLDLHTIARGPHRTCKEWNTRLNDGVGSRLRGDSTGVLDQRPQSWSLLDSPLRAYVTRLSDSGPKGTNFDGLNLIAEKMSHITHLKIMLVQERDYRGELPKFPPSLTELESSCNPTHDSSQGVFVEAIAAATNLTSLTLHNVRLDFFPAWVLLKLPSLRRLSISPQYFESWSESFQRILWQLPLEYLSLGDRWDFDKLNWSLATRESPLARSLKDWSFRHNLWPVTSAMIAKLIELDMHLHLESLDGQLAPAALPLIGKFTNLCRLSSSSAQPLSPDETLELLRPRSGEIEVLTCNFLPPLTPDQLLNLMTPMKRLRELQLFISVASLEFLQYTPQLDTLYLCSPKNTFTTNDLLRYLPCISSAEMIIISSVAPHSSDPSDTTTQLERIFRILHPGSSFPRLDRLYITGKMNSGASWSLSRVELQRYWFPLLYPVEPPTPVTANNDWVDEEDQWP